MSRRARIFYCRDPHVLRRLSMASLAMTAALVLFVFSFPMAAGQQALDLGGSPKDPLKQTPGKVVVLVFVRTDCPISNRALVYHGRIDDLYREFGKARRAATTHELADAIEAASKGVAPPSAAAEGVGCFISDLK